MKLLAISDLHVGFRDNMQALLAMSPRRDDWLLVAGDVAEREDDVVFALGLLKARYAHVIWVPGNHELWTTDSLRGESKYRRLVDRSRALGVTTPEDPYPVWSGEGGRHLIAPLFLLYDYSFAPDGMDPDAAIAWAGAHGLLCADEMLLHPDPYPSRQAWCAARCQETEKRLASAVRETGLPLVLVNHYPLKRSLAHLPAIPRFAIWCGTRRTETWPSRFGAQVVVSGHLHVRSTRILEGVRFEEVSLGYARRQWTPEFGIDAYLRQILPPVQGASSDARAAARVEPRGA
jgi:predicted phosphodiesterase